LAIPEQFPFNAALTDSLEGWPPCLPINNTQKHFLDRINRIGAKREKTRSKVAKHFLA